MDKKRDLDAGYQALGSPFSQTTLSSPKAQRQRSPNLDSGITPQEQAPYLLERADPLGVSNDLESYQSESTSVNIYTLGRFSPVADKRTIEIAKKPLTLLKVLIARNGRDVPEEDIAAILWPDSDGDVALQNFATTLYRLRKLFRKDDLILSRNGRVSLNATICNVDIWEFQRLVGLADSIRPRGDTENPRRLELLERAVKIYRGPFLEADGDTLPYVLRTREKLRSKFTRCIWDLSEHYEKQGLYREAIQIYKRSLEIDDTTEELYRRLMICHSHLKQRSEIRAVYQRHKQVLKETMGLAPDQETQRLYEQLLNEHR